MAYSTTSWVDDGAPAISAANLNKMETGIKDAHDLIAAKTYSPVGGVRIEEFAGASDDAKFAAARSYAAAQTKRPAIMFDAKNYTLGPFNTYDGMRLIGVPGGSNSADRSAESATATKITCTGSGAWMTSVEDAKPGQSWNVSIEGIAFKGNSNLSWWLTGSIVCWIYNIRDCSMSGFKTVYGSQSSKLLINACTFDGYHNINNSYQGAINIGGSDNSLWIDGLLLDSTTAALAAGGASNQFHMTLSSLSKTTIGGGDLYITNEGGWGGIKVTGGGTGGPIIFNGLAIVEGRNAGAPGTNASVRIDGGWSVFNNLWASFTSGVSPYQQTAGLAVIKNASYMPATAPPTYWGTVSGGRLKATDGFSYVSSTPANLAIGRSGTGVVTADSTYTVTG